MKKINIISSTQTKKNERYELILRIINRKKRNISQAICDLGITKKRILAVNK